MTQKKTSTETINWIFDFDGTIADSMPAMIAVFNKNIRGNENPLTPEEIQRLRNMGSRKAIRNLGVRWWQVPKLLMQGLPDFKALVPQLKSFSGLPETIRKLHQRGDRIFMVTSNTRDSVDEFLLQHGLSEYFEDIITGSGLFRKSKHIRKLIKVHGLARKSTFYIGDETRDIQAAKLARVKMISVSWGFNTRQALRKHRPAYIINSPKELLDIQPKGSTR